MNLAEVMDEVAMVLAGITGLRVFSFPPDSLTDPAGFVSYPASVDFDETYGRGEDRFTDLPMVLVSSRVTDRAARNTVAAWASGSGPKSVKALMEAHTWVSCDDLTVTSCEFDVEMIAGTGYLAAVFKATVVGPGE
jgi:hypothetical protein